MEFAKISKRYHYAAHCSETFNVNNLVTFLLTGFVAKPLSRNVHFYSTIMGDRYLPAPVRNDDYQHLALSYIPCRNDGVILYLLASD